MKAFLLTFVPTLTLALCLTGCGPDENSITKLREYNINDYLTTVGQGTWLDNGKFRIKTYNGQTWDLNQDSKILEGPVSLESFARSRKAEY